MSSRVMLARTRRRRADRRISHLIHCSISIIIIIIINNHQLPLHHKKRSTSVYIWPMHSGSLSTAELVSKENAQCYCHITSSSFCSTRFFQSYFRLDNIRQKKTSENNCSRFFKHAFSAAQKLVSKALRENI